MLTIRKEQMAVLEAHLDGRFRVSLRQHLRAEFATETTGKTDTELGQLIQLAIERARGYEVTTERDIALFAGMMIMKGRDFDRDPKLLWVRKILIKKDLDGTARMEAIYRRLEAMTNRTAMPEVIH